MNSRIFNRLTAGAPLLTVIIACLTLAAIAASGVVLWQLYRTAFAQQRDGLLQTAEHQARLIESVTAFDEDQSLLRGGTPEEGRQNTLEQIRNALRAERNPGLIEEVIGVRDGDAIVFQVSDHLVQENRTVRIPWDDPRYGEPMRRALRGETGTVVGPDYEGKPVLAAYTPLRGLDAGLVIKTPMAAIHTPFLKAAFTGGGIALLAIMGGFGASVLIARAINRQADEREAQHAIMFEQSAVSYLVVENRMIRNVNQRCQQLLGQPKEAIAGARLSEFSPLLQPSGEESEALLRGYFYRAENGEEVQFIWRLLGPNNDPVDCDVVMHPLTIRDKPVIMLSLRDITEELQREQRLAIQESALQSTQNGIVIADAEKEDTPLVWVNQAFCAMTGYDREEVLGKNCRFLQGADRNQSALPKIREAVRDKEPISATLRNYRKDGSQFINSLRIDPIVNDHGVVTHFIGMAQDITASVKQAERLKLFQRVADQSPAAVIITDTKGNIEYVNQRACESSGYSESELIGQNPRIFKSGLNSSRFYEEMWDNLTRGERWTGELINRRKDGETYTEYVYAFPIRGTGGEITHFAAEKEDITLQRQSEAEKAQLSEQLLQLQRIETIGTLAGGIAHDFNNLIGAIRGWSELAQRHANGNENVIKDLSHVLQASDRARDLVQQILTFSRQNETRTATFNFASLVKEMTKLLQSTIPDHVAVNTEIAGGAEAMVSADPAQLQQVVLNLCTNAVYAMKDQASGQLDVRVDLLSEAGAQAARNGDGENFVRLHIKDTGCGMDATTKNRIFEPFFTTKPVGEGTGMGLSVCFGIIRSLGGQISVESELGRGTEFTVLLPTARNQEEESAEPSTARPLPGDDRVLLVDDDEAMVTMAESHLSELGYQVTAFRDSQSALRAINERPGAFDILVTDQVMPRCTGMELVTAYRRMRPNAPAIIMTGYRDSVDLRKLAEIGNLELIAKPYSLSDLTRMIRRRIDLEPPGPESKAPVTNDPER